MIEQLKEQIKVVVEYRQTAKVFKERKESTYTEWETQNRILLDDTAFAVQQVVGAEDKLRDLTLKAYTLDPTNKKPADGVGIREVTKLEYDGKVALAYAKEHLLFLQLNKTAFEKFAKDEEPDFVTITTEPQATIAAKLESV